MAAWDFEVTSDRPLARRILGEDVVLWRDEHGKPVAMVDRCCHRLAPLSLGRLEGSNLRCMYHGLLFDSSGQCVQVPRQRVAPRALKVRTFPLIEQDRYLWIWMGEQRLAHPKKVHDAHWQNSPAWRSIPGYVHYESASYLLVMDNLLDFSHLGFVHETSLGGGKSAEIQPTVEPFEWGVRISRWYHDDDMPPYLRGIAKFEGQVDRWQIYEWHAAGNFLSMASGAAPAGSGAREGNIVDEACVFHSIQSLTPETEISTHYFWTFAHNFELENGELTRELTQRVGAAFEEDKRIIQAQQRVIIDHPFDRMAAIRADRALHHVRRLIQNGIKAEACPPC